MKKILFALIIGVVFIFHLTFAQVNTTLPSQNALNIPRATNIEVTFSSDINPQTLTNSSIRIHGSQSGLHTSSMSYNSLERKATINPNEDFTVGEVVSVSLTSGITIASSGVPIVPYSWSFTIQYNVSAGTFATKVDYGTGNSPHSVYIYDLDGDGDGDIITANWSSNTVSVIKSNGDDTYTTKVDYVTGNNPYFAFVSDIDDDGDGDIAVANNGSNTVSILKNNGNGVYSTKVDYATGGNPIAIFISDIDGDGDGDIATANYGSGTVTILKNNGDGTFALKVDYATGIRPWSVYLNDVDGDGDYDLAVANSNSNTVSILKNNGDGTYISKVDYATGNNPYSVFVNDIDADGDGDLVTANYGSNTVSILKNNGNGTYSTKTDYAAGANPVPVYISDVDGDSDGDIITANWSSNTVSILKNNGNGSYSAKVDYATGSNPHSVIIGDIDADGDGDLVVANQGSNTISTFKNINGTSAYTITATAGSNGSISPSGNVRVNSGSNEQFTISPNTGYHVDSVIVDGVLVDSINSYTFSNVSSNHTISVKFTVNEAAIVITLPATQIGGTSARLNGSVNPNGISTIVTFQYGLTTSYGNTIAATPSPVTGNDAVSVSALLTGLTQNTEYHFRVVASNEFTATVYGNDETFTTTNSTNNPPMAIAGFDSVKINTSKLLTLQGTDSDEGDSISAYVIKTFPAHGFLQSFNSAAGTVVYSPEFFYAGTDTFTFSVKDAQNIESTPAPFIVTVYQYIDSTTFRTFSQEDWVTPAVKIPKKGKRPMPTTGNVLDTIMTNVYPKLKVKTNPNFPGGVILGIKRTDSVKSYGWIRLIGKGKDVQKFLPHSGTARGFDKILGKTFLKEVKNPKVERYNNSLVGELLALKMNLAASADSITNPDFVNLVFDDPLQPNHLFAGKALTEIARFADTTLTYYKRYYTGATPPAMYNTMAIALRSINEAFHGKNIDTISVKPLRLRDSVRIDSVSFLRKGGNKETADFILLENNSSLPEEIYLQNYPNPFNPTTAIRFHLPSMSIVSLKVYDVLGREVATMLNNDELNEGEHETRFDASHLPSGIYFYKLTTQTYSHTNKLLLLR
ncbi:MAG: VCBS repeat-containing protein [Ignavibacteriales bacterium]|nr:VCBS repeat-containing protein [Ignavibacteriales bacterium]